MFSEATSKRRSALALIGSDKQYVLKKTTWVLRPKIFQKRASALTDRRESSGTLQAIADPQDRESKMEPNLHLLKRSEARVLLIRNALVSARIKGK